jgi:hypothetical protein
VLVAVSDGVIHAGIGAILNLGWQWDDVAGYLEGISQADLNANEFCRELLEACNQLYAGKPGDDATVMTLQIREPRTLTVAFGPPQSPEDDHRLVQIIREEAGKKVVCGGTTGTIVAREMGQNIEVDLEQPLDPDVPPTGRLHGIDLLTEGIITVSKALNYLKVARSPKEIESSNGAADLAKLLMNSDRIRFLVGRAINPAHQNPDLPISLALKMQVVGEIAEMLKHGGKQVEVTYF